MSLAAEKEVEGEKQCSSRVGHGWLGCDLQIGVFPFYLLISHFPFQLVLK